MPDLPFLVESDSSIDVVEWVKRNVALLDTQLTACGAVLLRGFVEPTEQDFRAVVEICCGPALKYMYRSTPRIDLGGNLYTATEYPSGLKIPFHNENSFQREWPLLLLFYCELPAQGGGGNTPLADSQRVTRRIDPVIRKKLFERKVMYIRNYHGDIDLSWQVVFQTESRSEVEQFCKNNDISCEWTGKDSLKTRQVCHAFAKNLRTGMAVWFNQAHLFHPSSLDHKSRKALIRGVQLGQST